MSIASTLGRAWLLGLLGIGLAAAQEPPASAVTPQAPAAPIEKPRKPAAGSAQAEAGEPRAQAPAAPASAADPAHPRRPASATDRLNLGVATVTGDREQPKVMYVVPWKKPDIGDLSGKPMNSLLDEVLAPVDRDEFKREVSYYEAMSRDAAQHGGTKPPAQGEK